MPLLMIQASDGSLMQRSFIEQLTIGRHESNDLVLPAGGVSRNHARFFVVGRNVMIEDAGSANGTWVDGERIGAAVRLSPENRVKIASYELWVKDKEAVSSEAFKQNGVGTTVASGKHPTVGLQLVGVTGPVAGKNFSLAGTMIVGRTAEVDIQIDDDSVSREHAQLVVTGSGVVLRDLRSANGTSVNATPILRDVTLHSGDVIHFGAVKFTFEATSERPRSGRKFLDFKHIHSSMQGRRRKQFLVASVGIFSMLLIVKILTAAFSGEKAQRTRPVDALEYASDQKTQIETLLAECRMYASVKHGRPDWSRAHAACEKVIELEPIHEEAHRLRKTIRFEKACETHLTHAQESIMAGRLEAALDAYALVTPDCPFYFLRALVAAKETVAEVQKLAGIQCKTYISNAKWENAYNRCKLYMRLACQTMDETDLYPPPLKKMKLRGSLGATGWRPKAALYLHFLKAREKLKPGAPPWKCPHIPVFRPPVPIERNVAIKQKLRRRYDDPGLGQGLVLYFDGKFHKAPIPIQRVLEDVHKAQYHAEAQQLLVDINNATNYYQNGITELTNEQPERAVEPFQKALALDAKLMLGKRTNELGNSRKENELNQHPTFVRRTIVEMMSSNCYRRGKVLADRRDYRKACKIWKMGASFGRSNLDLLKALTDVCTQKARFAFESAENCTQFQQVLDFAVEGDGFRQQADAALARLGCH